MLSKKCGNCIYNSIAKYEPTKLLILNFIKIDSKISYLEKLEEEALDTKVKAFAAL